MWTNLTNKDRVSCMYKQKMSQKDPNKMQCADAELLPV